MAKAVEAVGAREQPAPVRALPAPRVNVPPPKTEPIPLVLPAISLRGQVAELSGSLALAVLLAALLSTLCAAVVRTNDLSWIGALFFLTVAISWGVLIPAKFWTGRNGDSWVRRVVMLGMGVLIGACALWLNGWSPRTPSVGSTVLILDGDHSPEQWLVYATREGISVGAGYLSYFALALCALRWWKMTDRYRSHRFSCFPLLAAGFWGLILLPICWPGGEPYGVVALVMSSIIVQLVSPWEQPPPPSVKRMRLRYA
jgi:hypothetical protein